MPVSCDKTDMQSKTTIKVWGVCLALMVMGLVVRVSPAKAGVVTSCPIVQTTNRYLFTYGSVTINGQPAPVNTVIEARNAQNVTAGCLQTTSAGIYPLMHIYGADSSVTPAVPGMATNEPIRFFVNGFPAVASPALNWTNSKSSTQVNLSVTIHQVFVTNSQRATAAGW